MLLKASRWRSPILTATILAFPTLLFYLRFTSHSKLQPTFTSYVTHETWSSRYGSTTTSSSLDNCRIWSDWDLSDPEKFITDLLPQPTRAVIGEPKTVGAERHCVHAASRFRQYGKLMDIDWSVVRWGEIQTACARASFRDSVPRVKPRKLGLPHDEMWTPPTANHDKPRTAIVLRSWGGFNYSDSRLPWLRALITETSLHSHGEFQVFMLVDVLDNSIPLFNDTEAYDRALQEKVPAEFHDMAYLFNREMLHAWYPWVTEHGSNDQRYQALQIFSHHHPEFDFFWQLEMDVRFTGNALTTFSNIASWARNQPRKNLWERNGQFYIPSLHNSYPDFSARVDLEIDDRGIWGPARAPGFLPLGPSAPSKNDEHWGIGEEPDLITLMPMIDVHGTDWIYEDMIHGFEDGKETPRRLAIVSNTRTSRRLLHLISTAQRDQGLWLASEATPETFAFLHGLKGVSIPHPISFNVNKSVEEIDRLVHQGPFHSRAGGHGAAFLWTSQGTMDPDKTWKKASYFYDRDEADRIWTEYMDGQCTRPMILHPVKQT